MGGEEKGKERGEGEERKERSRMGEWEGERGRKGLLRSLDCVAGVQAEMYCTTTFTDLNGCCVLEKVFKKWGMDLKGTRQTYMCSY